MKKFVLSLLFGFLFVGYVNAEVIDIIPNPPPTNSFQVRGINDNNIIVGLYNVGNGHMGFVCDEESNCTYHQPESISTYFTDINNNGIISVYAGSLTPKLYNMNTEEYIDINPNLPNAQQYALTGLNDDLILVGRYKTNGDLRNHAMAYYDGNAISFDYEDYENCIALKINNMGESLISCGNSPTQNYTYIVVQININPLSYTIIEEIDINSIVPYPVENLYCRLITDSRNIYGTFVENGILKAFKYNLNNYDFEILFDNTMFDFSTLYDVNNVGDVTGKYSDNLKGYIWVPVQDIIFQYNPNIFHLITKNNKTRLVTSGWLDELLLDVEEGDMVPVTMTVKYEGIGPNGENIIIEYNDIHVVEGDKIIKN